MKKFNIFLPIIFLTLVFLIFRPTSAGSAYYKYVDKEGNVHFTDRYETIPEEYRNQIKIIKEKRDDLTPEQPLLEKKIEKGERQRPEEQVHKEREDEQKKIAAEQEALKKKEAQEAKLKAREEKEKRIEELTKQIEAKRQQQKILRPWMVNEGRIFRQLNQEIETLHKEIQSIQKELAADQ